MPTPNQAMKDEAQRGLDWREEYGRGGTQVGVSRARDIVNGRNLSMDTVRRMVSYFARHEVDKEAEGFRPGEDGYPSAGRIAWALWGGDAGRSWANRIVDQEDNERSVMGDKEIRMAATPEIRAEGDTVSVAGYAAVFGEETNVGGMFIEVIERGAFVDAIGRDDVVFLINHDGLPLARSRAGTLKLTEDDRGLYMEADLDTSDPDVARIVPKMRRGDLDKMSFAFWPERQEWDDTGDMPKRIIREASLHDVSIVTTPQYNGTEIALRSLQEHRGAQQEDLQSWRLRMKRKLLR